MNKYSDFSMYELVAMYTALDSQIEEITLLLNSPKTPFEYRGKLNDSLRYSKSAYQKLDKIFESENYSPYQN